MASVNLFVLLQGPTRPSSIRLTPETINTSATMVLARETIEFKACDGTVLRGWFYPQVEKSACVIMTHGVRTL
jgi:hypothetical protein